MMKSFLILSLGVIFVGCTQKAELESLALGTFAAPPEFVNVRIENYQPQPGKVLQHIFASNFSVVVEAGQLKLSSARDGIEDNLKIALSAQYGFNTWSPESVVNGFSDLVLFKLGLNLPKQANLFCSPNQMGSTSNDAFVYTDSRTGVATQTVLGLRDCQKAFLSLNSNLFSNAGDGIPDYLKLRCGLNPANKADAYLSTAGDGMANIDKCKKHIPVDEDHRSQPNQLFAYRYSNENNIDGSKILKIDNISILNGGEGNFLAFYIVETDLSSKELWLTTAFAVLKSGYSGQTLIVDYWVKGSSTRFNQEITFE